MGWIIIELGVVCVWLFNLKDFQVRNFHEYTSIYLISHGTGFISLFNKKAVHSNAKIFIAYTSVNNSVYIILIWKWIQNNYIEYEIQQTKKWLTSSLIWVSPKDRNVHWIHVYTKTQQTSKKLWLEKNIHFQKFCK